MSAPGVTTRVPRWPLLLLAAPAFVAIWSGWVGLGELAGFGVVHPLPGIVDDFTINTAITLPIGMECYAAYALGVWLTPGVPDRARRFARTSAIGALVLGALGQVAYHLMTAAEVTAAPWQITTLVSCLPVAVLGMGAALVHLLGTPDGTDPVGVPVGDVPPTGRPVGDGPGDDDAGTVDEPTAQVPPVGALDPLSARVAALVTTGRAEGRPVGRRTLARELRITEHEARRLLAAAVNGTGGAR